MQRSTQEILHSIGMACSGVGLGLCITFANPSPEARLVLMWFAPGMMAVAMVFFLLAGNQRQPIRRWLRFSLRTLFVLLTLLCVVLGWQLKIVRDRREMKLWVIAGGGEVYSGNEHLLDPFESIGRRAPAVASVPWYRRLLGDEEFETVLAPSSSTAEEIERIELLYPEALIGKAAMPEEPAPYDPRTESAPAANDPFAS